MSRLLVMALAAVLGAPAMAQDEVGVPLTQRLIALDANADTAGVAAYERLQARQAVDALANARSREQADAQYLAERRVQVAEIAAGTAVLQREVDRLERERSELLVEASRQDAARARAEAERLRIEAQVQAEEAARLRAQAAAATAAMADVEGALTNIEGAQEAKLEAARQREAALARKEAELVAGAPLPPSKMEARGEVFTLAGDAFASGSSTLTAAAAKTVAGLSAYLVAQPRARVRVEGHTDSQGQVDANQALSGRRANAVRDALVAGGVAAARIDAAGLGAGQPIADNANAAGRARNRRVELIVSSK